MHLALQVTDIVDRICSEPVLRSDSGLTSSTGNPFREHPLLSMALTCKTFTEPALRVLWRQIDGMDRLLRTMGKDIIKVVDPLPSTDRNIRRQPNLLYINLSRKHNSEDNDAWDEEWNQVSEDEWESHLSFSLQARGRRRPTRRYIIFKKEPVDEDWELFDRYAAYVWEFGNTGTNADDLKLAQNIYTGLQAHRLKKGTSLLPHLRSLACTSRQLRYASLLLHPGLHTLCIPPSIYNIGRAFVQDITSLANEIKRDPPVELNAIELYQSVSPDFVQLSSQMVINCHRKGAGLERVRVSSSATLTLEALRVVLTEKSAKFVDVKVEKFDFDAIFGKEINDQDKDIRALRIESIQTAKEAGEERAWLRTSFFHVLLQRLRAPKLGDFLIDGVPYRPRPRDINSLFSILQQGHGYAIEDPYISERVIIVALAKDVSHVLSPVDYACTFANSFHILCQPTSSNVSTSRFVCLHQLALDGVLVDFTDDELGTISAALPQLKTFFVETTREGRTGRSRTTLIGLWLMARNCRQLQKLGIWINAVFDWEILGVITGIEVPDDTAGQQTLLAEGRNENLELMVVGNSTIDNDAVAIKFFSTVFPKVTNFSYQMSRNPDRDEELWKKVKSALRRE